MRENVLSSWMREMATVAVDHGVVVAQSVPNPRHELSESLKEFFPRATRRSQNETLLSQLQAEFAPVVSSEYSHRVFRKAGHLFDALRISPTSDRSESEDSVHCQQPTKKNFKIKFKNDEERRKTLELTQAALPYQSVYEKVLDEAKFFTEYHSLAKEKGTVMVMLHDFLQRNFHPLLSSDKEEHGLTVQIADALMTRRTTINATLARERISKNVSSVEQLIPMAMRRCVEVLPSLPQYAWINHFKTNTPSLLKQLHKEGFSQVDNANELRSLSFCQDVECTDLLAFHPDCRQTLIKFCLVEMNHLIIQHKSSCLGAYMVADIIRQSQFLHVIVPVRSYVMVTNVGEGWTAAHLGSLLVNRAIVLTCASQTDTSLIEQRIGEMGAYNVKVVNKTFLECSPDDPSFFQVVAILITPRCSNSGISNPVDFILREGGDIQLLKEVAGLSIQPTTELTNFQQEQKKLVRHALSFPNVKHVVYTTHSIHAEENEGVVDSVLEELNEIHRKKCKRSPSACSLIQVEVNPENLFEVEFPDIYRRIADEKPSKFLKVKPNQWLEGCFMAVIKRQFVARVPAKEILNQAKAKGLLKDSDEKVNTDSSICRHKTTQTDTICVKCKKRGVFKGTRHHVPPFRLGGSLNHGTFPSAPKIVTSVPSQHIHRQDWPPVFHPFPIVKPRRSTKRDLYPLATKTLHLPGLSPMSYFQLYNVCQTEP